MAYIINRYNGTVLTSVDDGTINQSTELKFVGKNYSGYGEIQNENFLHLLENFASSTAPLKAISGQLWFDNSANKLKFYDGVKWRSAGSTEVANVEPVGLTEGDLWYKAATKQLFARTSDNNFILIGPQVAGIDVTQLISETVEDSSAVSKPIIKATIDGSVVFIVSDDEFTLSVGDSIPGFDVIKRGITLVNTQSNTGGQTVNAGSFNEAIIWGTASNALKLNGRSATEFVSVGDANFTNIVNVSNEGVNIDNILHMYVTNNTGIIENTAGPTISFIVDNGGVATTVFKVTNTGLIPQLTDTYDIGSTSKVWANVYATNLVGNATSATALKVSGTARQAATTASVNSIAARDSSGDIYANVFNGTATKARYADLAEKYTTGEEHPVGTIMTICDHEDHEADVCGLGQMPIGVISENPAYLMNNEIEGQAIGLKGRVPVRVVGPVTKGQAIYAWQDGVGTTIATSGLVGVALESNYDDAEKLVECVLKV